MTHLTLPSTPLRLRRLVRTEKTPRGPITTWGKTRGFGKRRPWAQSRFSLDQRGSDLSTHDFESLDRANDDRKATFVYNDGEFDLARINVRQLEGGWLVDSYEFCQGFLAGDPGDADEARGDVPPQFYPDPGGPGGSDTTQLFNTNELIGLNLDEAEAEAESQGCSVRVVEEDGEPLVGTSRSST